MKTRVVFPSDKKAFCDGMRKGAIIPILLYGAYQIGKRFGRKDKEERKININIHKD